MRDDKDPRDCERQGMGRAGRRSDGEPERRGRDPRDRAAEHRRRDAVEKTVTFSNLKKVYWPAERYTKGDLIEYYRAICAVDAAVSAQIGRVVLTRFPDGIDGKSFYQKDAPEFAPEWIRTVPIWSEDTQRDIRYFVCDDVESLLYVANMGSIPLHIWASRVGSLELPDWCVIDLDPKEAPFSDVDPHGDRVPRALRGDRAAELREDDRQDRAAHPDAARPAVHVRAVAARSASCWRAWCCASCGDIATITRHVTKRGDKVYLDYLQNRHGQLIVAPFSVRPLPGATVSMPLTWDEVNSRSTRRAFTIKTAVERMERLGRDPVVAGARRQAGPRPGARATVRTVRRARSDGVRLVLRSLPTPCVTR